MLHLRDDYLFLRSDFLHIDIKQEDKWIATRRVAKEIGTS
jgi:hypothetical protein